MGRDEDTHNPFGGAVPKSMPKPKDPDPFAIDVDEKDSEWDDQEPGPSTKDV